MQSSTLVRLYVSCHVQVGKICIPVFVNVDVGRALVFWSIL